MKPKLALAPAAPAAPIVEFPVDFEVLTMEEAAESMRVLASNDFIQSVTATGKWASICNAFATTWSEAARVAAADTTITMTDVTRIAAHKAFVTLFLDKSISADRKDVVRSRAQKQFSANMKLLRERDLKRAAPIYCWPPKVERAENAAKAAIEAWVKGASDVELVACAAMLPQLSVDTKIARENALATLTPTQRIALGL